MRDVVKKRQDNAEYKIINGERVRVNRKKRRRNMSIYYLMAFAVITISLVVLSVTIMFNANRIEISGNTVYTEEQIVEISGVSTGNNLVRLDTAAAEKRLGETLPYIEEVKVLRKLPDAVTIDIVEAVPIANIEYQGKYYLVSTNGKILEADLEKPHDDLVIVKGFELKTLGLGDEIGSDDSFKFNIFKTITATLERLEFEGISEVDITERTDIGLVYDKRIKILLGSSIDLDYKLTAVKTVMDGKVSDTFKGVVVYHNASSGISVISSDKLTGKLKSAYIGVSPENSVGDTPGVDDDINLQDKYHTGLV